MDSKEKDSKEKEMLEAVREVFGLGEDPWKLLGRLGWPSAEEIREIGKLSSGARSRRIQAR